MLWFFVKLCFEVFIEEILKGRVCLVEIFGLGNIVWFDVCVVDLKFFCVLLLLFFVDDFFWDEKSFVIFFLWIDVGYLIIISDFIGVDGKVLEIGVGIGDNILFNSKLDENIMDDGYSVWLFINLLIEENEWLMLENDVCNE